MWKKALRTAQSHLAGLENVKNLAYYFIRKKLSIPHEADFRYLKFLPRSKEDLYLDIGANHGQSILSIRTVRRDVPIVAFEPIPRLVAELNRRFADDRHLTIHPFGLSDQGSTSVLYTPVYRNFVYDGLTSMSKQAAGSWLSPETVYFFDPRKLRLEEQTCMVRKLDDLGLSPTFVKIDVEGGEYGVITGGRETLRRSEPVLLVERNRHDSRAFDLLRDLGYREVVPRQNGFVPGCRDSLNAFLMTEARLRAGA